MSGQLVNQHKTMGTLPVFMTAVSTILGAILFLKFGYSVAHVGLFGTLGIILIGHLVTVPTAMAVAEIATNQKVEGGGAYFIISRSFGLNIGGAIGIALFLSQAISVAFYVIAFTESFEPIRIWLENTYQVYLTKQMVTLSVMALLSLLILGKGADIGVKALYGVVVILFLSIIMFLLGKTDYQPNGASIFDHFKRWTSKGGVEEPDSFFKVFTIIFPAFTGIAAGLGLSGDLKDPKRSIPLGTLWATIIGIVIYVLVAYKLFYSVPLEELDSDPLIMSRVAIWGPIIPIGLACATVSSALGSIMIAPRTLQAMGADGIFPKNLNTFFGKGKAKNNEPFNASIVTCLIGFVFCAIGDIEVVAEVISMFFMVTYGAICMVSFFEHFAADPSYRPTFKSHWAVSLLGGLLCLWLMFQMNLPYALVSIAFMVLIYIGISRLDKDKKGLAKLFKGVIFQISREMQLLLQKREVDDKEEHWRPFVICVSNDTFKRTSAFDMVRWMAHRYGFGTYVHYMEGFLTKESKGAAEKIRERLIAMGTEVKSKVSLNTIISPSFTSAIAQTIQLPGVSGKGNNLILFEFTDANGESASNLIDNYHMLRASNFDICMLKSSFRGFGYRNSIHIWLDASQTRNTQLVVLLGYIILGHPEWKKGDLTIYSVYRTEDEEQERERLLQMTKDGRLPISPNNIQLVQLPEGQAMSDMVNQHSAQADLTIVGLTSNQIKEQGKEVFDGYEQNGNVLFVNANRKVEIDI